MRGLSISCCYNTGRVTSSTVNGGYSGGIIALGQPCNIANCYNKGVITGYQAGGIATWLRFRFTV